MTNPAKFEIPAEMRHLAEKSVDEARKAFEGYMDAATKALTAAEGSAEAVGSNIREVNRKALGFAEDNVAATLDFAQRLVRAKDAEEVMKLQADFTKIQLKNLTEQARSLAGSASETASKKSA